MSTKTIRKGQWITEYDYSLFYELYPGGGKAFECDAEGIMPFEELDDIAWEIRFEMQECGVAPNVERYVRRWYEPQVIECEACQRHVELHDALTNVCQCGAYYSGTGQRLSPPQLWEESERFMGPVPFDKKGEW